MEARRRLDGADRRKRRAWTRVLIREALINLVPEQKHRFLPFSGRTAFLPRVPYPASLTGALDVQMEPPRVPQNTLCPIEIDSSENPPWPHHPIVALTELRAGGKRDSIHVQSTSVRSEPRFIPPQHRHLQMQSASALPRRPPRRLDLASTARTAEHQEHHVVALHST